MRVTKRGIRRPDHPWAERHWKAHCGTVVYLEEGDSLLVDDYEDDQRDGEIVRIMCPVCQRSEWFYPTKGEEG